MVRLISAGTLVEDAFLTPRQSNYLCALSSSVHSQHYGFSVIDISTGEVNVHTIEEKQLPSLLARYEPKEILISSTLQNQLPIVLVDYIGGEGEGEAESETEGTCVLTCIEECYWREEQFSSLLEQKDSQLQAIGIPYQHHLFSSLETQSLAALCYYINTTQMGSFPRLFMSDKEKVFLELDRNSRDSLNLTRGYHNTVVGSVLNVLIVLLKRSWV